MWAALSDSAEAPSCSSSKRPSYGVWVMQFRHALLWFKALLDLKPTECLPACLTRCHDGINRERSGHSRARPPVCTLSVAPQNCSRVWGGGGALQAWSGLGGLTLLNKVSSRGSGCQGILRGGMWSVLHRYRCLLDPLLLSTAIATDESAKCFLEVGFGGSWFLRAPSFSFVSVTRRIVRFSFCVHILPGLYVSWFWCVLEVCQSICPQLAMERVPSGFLPTLRRVA